MVISGKGLVARFGLSLSEDRKHDALNSTHNEFRKDTALK